MAPKVSVLVSTFRPGGLDITFAGLRDQSFTDYELILIDRRYEKRHYEVAKLAEAYRVPTIHIPEHRRNGKWMSLAAGWNTGMAVARGEYVLFFQDYCYMPPGFIEKHLEGHAAYPNTYIVAPYRYVTSPPYKLLKFFDFAGQRDRGGNCVEPDEILKGGVIDEIYAYDKPFSPLQIITLEETKYPHQDTRVAALGPGLHFTWIHLKNESLLRSKALEVNGLDERLDRGKGPIDIDWGLRLVRSGTPLVWWTSPMAYCIDPRNYIRTMPWGAEHERLEGRWSYDDGVTYNQRRDSETVNGQNTRALNPLDLNMLSHGLEGWRDCPPQNKVWRDLPDEVYFGKEIWPDTP